MSVSRARDCVAIPNEIFGYVIAQINCKSGDLKRPDVPFTSYLRMKEKLMSTSLLEMPSNLKLNEECTNAGLTPDLIISLSKDFLSVCKYSVSSMEQYHEVFTFKNTGMSYREWLPKWFFKKSKRCFVSVCDCCLGGGGNDLCSAVFCAGPVVVALSPFTLLIMAFLWVGGFIADVVTGGIWRNSEEGKAKYMADMSQTHPHMVPSYVYTQITEKLTAAVESASTLKNIPNISIQVKEGESICDGNLDYVYFAISISTQSNALIGSGAV